MDEPRALEDLRAQRPAIEPRAPGTVAVLTGIGPDVRAFRRFSPVLHRKITGLYRRHIDRRASVFGKTSRLVLALIAGSCIGGCGRSSEERVLAPAVWSRHDAMPPGVPREVSESRPRAVSAICEGATYAPSQPLEIGLDRRPAHGSRRGARDDRPQLGETLQICPRRFDPTRPVMIAVRRSDGSVISRRLVPESEEGSSDAGYFASFLLDRSWPLGRAAATARQGSTVARIAFRIDARRRRAVRVQEWFGRPALPNPLTIMVVGQRPRSSVPVDVYSRPEHEPVRYRYATTLNVRTDARGIGQVRVRYSRANNDGYELRLRGAGAPDDPDLAAHISICVRCCEADPDEPGSAYCAN